MREIGIRMALGAHAGKPLASWGRKAVPWRLRLVRARRAVQADPNAGVAE